MKIARIIDNIVTEVGEHTTLFPNTSFGGEPNAAFLSENQCLPAFAWRNHNQNTHRLAPAAPYVEGDMVFTVVVVELTQAELDDNAAATLEAVKAQRAEAYRTESDPLFFKWQAGESTQEIWLKKREEIRAKFV